MTRVRSTQKLPIVAERRRVSPRMRATATAIPTAADDEVLHGEPCHLGQVAHRRFAAVVLPVRVRDEARSGVEGQRGRNTVDVRRVQEEHALQPLKPVQPDNRHDTEREERDRVHGPRLLAVRVDPRQPVDPSLDQGEDSDHRARPRRRGRVRGMRRAAASSRGGLRRARRAAASSRRSPKEVPREQAEERDPERDADEEDEDCDGLEDDGHPSFSGARSA